MRDVWIKIRASFGPHEKVTLEWLYGFEKQFRKLHPENRAVKAKLRQTCQFLVKEGLLRRVSPGLYEVTGDWPNSVKKPIIDEVNAIARKMGI